MRPIYYKNIEKDADPSRVRNTTFLGRMVEGIDIEKKKFVEEQLKAKYKEMPKVLQNQQCRQSVLKRFASCLRIVSNHVLSDFMPINVTQKCSSVVGHQTVS